MRQKKTLTLEIENDSSNCFSGYQLGILPFEAGTHANPQERQRGRLPTSIRTSFEFIPSFGEKVEKQALITQIKSDGQEISSIEWRELKSRFLPFCFHRQLLAR